MAIFFTSDTHFGHGNIIRYCNRPFRTSEEMDETLFANWQAVVRPQDTVYHLGDVAFGNREQVFATMERFRRLPGRKFLVPGNHDHRYPELIALGFAEVLPPLVSVAANSGAAGGNARLVLCHYPLQTWDGVFRGARQLYGHVHGRIPANRLQCDVGVDVWGFAPARLEAVLARMGSAPEYINPEHRANPEEMEE